MKNPPHSRLSSLPRDLSRCESGNALIELAFSLPLFLVLILGTAEIANLAWASVQVNNAARAGAAYASQSRANSAPTNTNIGVAAQNEAPKLITSPSTQVTSTQLCSCVDSSGSSTSITCDTNALTNCPAPGTIQVAVQVNVQAPVTPLVHYPGLPATYTISAQATMGVAQ
jgi:Flp pilus assembly protein TadG